MKARHRGLSLPDAIALVIAEMIKADAVWTFDRRWRDVHQRVANPLVQAAPKRSLAFADEV